ncbi:protein MET1, chloroplastic-like [Phragmites australis]|uniref:protein MET1, chloroplastic-like n=1 Tax=Phragmites australis TaxID=29695 RepID=UPI002D775776|nr:protein MET1, chloroplastic-like [Phragmites australis]
MAHQVAANQPPLLSSPARHPRTGSGSSNAKLLLLQPPFLGRSLRLRGARMPVARASSAQAEPKSEGGEGGGEAEEEDRPYEEYEVTIVKPYGLKFAKGRNGGTYVEAIFPGAAAEKTGQFTVGDKVLATSAVFGEEIWPAAGYGQTMYCIRQRVGPLYMKMERRFGKWDGAGELTEKEIIRAERNSGVISNRVREIQLQNYQRKMEQKMQREEDLRMGLRLYKDGKYEEALEKFESVLGSKPESNEASIASYNVACSYSKLDRVQAGLSALEDALKAGYEDFKRIRTDTDLENLRKAEEFEPLLKNYDESFINENAINAIKSLFGFGKK